MTKPSQDWIDDCMKWRGVVLTGKAAHWCHDWDDLPVDETTDEITACHCDLSNLPGAEEARGGKIRNLSSFSPAAKFTPGDEASAA